MIVNPMKKWLIIPIMVMVWLLALLYSSGIGQSYDVYGKTKLLIIALAAYHVFLTMTFRHIGKNIFILISYLVLSSLFTHFAYGNDMFDYLWIYLLIPLMALLPIEELPMKKISIIYGALGMAVLCIYNYGSVFSGWNKNSIAIIAFFSFAVMLVSFNKMQNSWTRLFLGIYTIIYYQWTEVLNSRSGVLFTLIIILGALEILPFRKWLKRPKMITALLLFPLILAVFIIWIHNTDLARQLEIWSYATFRKPIFNGRDILWYRGFEQWLNHPIIGNGDLSAANWHNSAVTVLVGGGIVGFSIWIVGIRYILIKGIEFLDDQIILGLVTGFMAIWLQQSVELGLVAEQVNAIPYAMLGLLLGRVRTLQKRDKNKVHKVGDV